MQQKTLKCRDAACISISEFKSTEALGLNPER